VDQVGRLLIFNIRRNAYRLIVKVDYRSKLLTVKELLTHKEYEKKAWTKWC
jgi:mRNA-degrading endonuclease HigB of HigAB toxin-antitoxin module